MTQSSQGISINNIKKVAKHLATNPDASYATTWLELAVVLETGPVFSFAKLHELNHNEFRLAMGMIDDWRLDRHYLSKLVLLDHTEIKDAPTVQYLVPAVPARPTRPTRCWQVGHTMKAGLKKTAPLVRCRAISTEEFTVFGR